MLKSVVFGVLTTIVSLFIFGYAISTFLPQEIIPVGQAGWREQHDQLVSMHGVKVLTVIGWAISAFAGGAIASVSQASKGLRPALYTCAVILLVWAVPTTIIVGSTITWVHVASILVVLPSMCCGALLVGKICNG